MKILRLATAIIFGLTAAVPALAAKEKVAVAHFDFKDTSGEVRNQTEFHTASIKELQATLVQALDKTGRFDAVPLTCKTPPCSVDNLDAATFTNAAKKDGATLVVFGGVHKISTLITFGRIAMVNVDTGKSLLDRALTFRGDDKDAWQHADAYMANMVLSALPGGK